MSGMPSFDYQRLFVFFIPLSLALTLIALWAIKSFSIPRVARTYKDAARVRSLLNPPNASLDTLLLSRATPNQRLVHAFGLTNTFVSADVNVHKAFVTSAKELIVGAGTASGDKETTWRAAAMSAESTSYRFLQQLLPTPRHDAIPFATFIQCVTFAVVLSILFHVDIDGLQYEDVVYVTQVINQRWTDSKIKNAAEIRRDESGSLQRLMEQIERWIVVDDSDYNRKDSNPLNFILPAYETMWRVVAVTVAQVYQSRNNTLHDTVVAFGRESTESCFWAFGEGGEGPSMEAIVLEVLRLYPPTRHITRASIPTTTECVGRRWSWWHACVSPAEVVEIADIEAVHLSDEYGSNTQEFDPMRFHPMRTSSESPRGRPAELYAFGFGRLKCVAAAWAPMAAAVIAAKVVVQIEEAGCTVKVGSNIGGRSGWEGWSVMRTNEKS